MTNIDRVFVIYKNESGQLIINAQNTRTKKSTFFKATPSTIERIKRIAFDSYGVELKEYWVNRKRLTKEKRS